MTTPTNPEFDKLKKYADEILDKGHWNAATVVSLATSLAVHVNSFVSLSGSEKKKLVVEVVKEEINEALEESRNAPGDRPGKLSSDELQVLLFFVENALPAVLDSLVAVARGKIDLKKVVPRSWASCFSCCAASAVNAVPPAPVPSSVAVVSSAPPAALELKEEPIPLQSNPLYVGPEEKYVDKQTPQENNNHVVTVVQSVSEESPESAPVVAPVSPAPEKL